MLLLSKDDMFINHSTIYNYELHLFIVPES